MRYLVLIPLLCGLGCLDLDADRDQGTIRNRKIVPPAITEASVEQASRVDLIGRQLVNQNPFLGLDPVFQTFGLQDPEIWHPDFNAVFITEGLVKLCPSDEELAAVLAHELAKMAEEQRAAAKVRRLEPLQPGSEGPLPGGNIAAQSHDLAINALADQKLGQSGPTFSYSQQDIDSRAGDILQSAGFDAKHLQQVQPLLKQARSHRALSRQFGGRGDAPTWTR